MVAKRDISPVLQLISSLEVGGAERLLIETLRAARRHSDAQFVVIVMNDRVDADLALELKEIGYPTFFLGRRQGHLHPRYLIELLRIVKKNRIRVIHAHNTGAKYWAAALKLVVPGLKVVYTVHDTMTFSDPKHLSARIHGWIVDHTIAISEAVLDQCKAAAIAPTTLVWNGVDLSRFSPRDARGFHAPPRLICVGRLAPEEKGQDLLVDALGLLARRGYTVACSFVGPEVRRRPPFVEDELRQQARSLAISDHVSFVTDCKEVSTLLLHADILVLPSRREGFGLAALEAMAAGLPCVVCDQGGPPRLVRDGLEGVHFRSGDAGDLANKIEKFLFKPDEALRMGCAGVARANEFDIRTMLERYLAVYDELARS